VNGVKVDKPSYSLRPGDIITVRPRENLQNLYRRVSADATGADSMDWLTFDAETLRATVLGAPAASDISIPVDVNIVVEFLSR